MRNRKHISTSASAVATALARIDEEVHAIEHDLTRLDHTAAQLSQRWTGEARQAYSIAHADLVSEYRGLAAIAHQLTAISRRATEDFVQVERANARAWQ